MFLRPGRRPAQYSGDTKRRRWRPFTLPSSGGKAPFVQECLFVRRGGAAQNAVAVGEAPEAADDLGMVLRPLRAFSQARLSRQFDAAHLVGELLRMHEGQIEEFLQ